MRQHLPVQPCPPCPPPNPTSFTFLFPFSFPFLSFQPRLYFVLHFLTPIPIVKKVYRSDTMPKKFESGPPPEDENLPDRPLECSDCKKPIANEYTEIIGPNVLRSCMCSDCPVLERRLFGLRANVSGDYRSEGGTGLVCGNCGTTLEALRVGTA